MIAAMRSLKSSVDSIGRCFIAAHSYHFVIAVWRTKRAESSRVKYWGIIADNLHDAGWSLGWVSALDLEGRMIWIVHAHRDGKRFVVHTDEKLTAFLELEAATAARRAPGSDQSAPTRKKSWTRPFHGAIT
jgi:hypothetical protein